MFACNLDGPLVWAKETENDYASVGRVCQWGAFTVATISNEVPDGEGDEYAAIFAASFDLYDACAEFVRKVEAGEAKSTKSYKQMKDAIKKADQWKER